MRRTKQLIAVAALGLSLSLTGCATQAQQEAARSEKSEKVEKQRDPREHYSFEQKLPDGEKVLCVWAENGYESGGLSCDWEGLAADRKQR